MGTERVMRDENGFECPDYPNDCWRRMLTSAMFEHGESWADVVSCTLDDAELDRVFDPGFGSAEGTPFWLWTKRRVYFATEYDGSEDVKSVPLSPAAAVGESPEHI
jgi:hypothetical protein